MRLTIPQLKERASAGEKLTMLTCYDASFAALLEGAGVEMLLVGDSLGMVIQGHDNTLAVNLEQLDYHVRCVARGSRSALIIADLPSGSYQESPEQAYRSSARMLAAGAQMVKLEGGQWLNATVRFLVERGIPVCGHLGLLPQSVHRLGGYKVQGKDAQTAQRMKIEAKTLVESGVDLLVLEAVPAALAAEITQTLAIPTIGIGAGRDCSGQVLVLYDVLGIYPGKPARFVRNFMNGATDIRSAISAYVKAVKAGIFPGAEHSF